MRVLNSNFTTRQLYQIRKRWRSDGLAGAVTVHKWLEEGEGLLHLPYQVSTPLVPKVSSEDKPACRIYQFVSLFLVLRKWVRDWISAL